ncbi:MAG TPA: large conductance mechanosensitive channel protein MscL [Arenibaculum sp.]|nr:large conductance mechanosensitive channel protein MscL [Arenibaculum sp.]
MFQEFRKFIARGNVVELAVGIIMGTAFTAIVNSLVRDVVMPPIGVILGGLDFSEYYLNLSGNEYPSLAAAQEAGAATINYGVFVNTVINFLIVSLAVFLLIRQINRFDRRDEKNVEMPAPPPRQEVLLEEIRDLLRDRRP